MVTKIMGKTPETKFVLLSSARSGTTAVMTSLRAHPDVFNHHAIFSKNLSGMLHTRFKKSHDMGVLGADPDALLDAVLAFTPRQPCVGFKMWYRQNPAICGRILADPSIKKIILERKNKLALASSRQLARASGTWHIREDNQSGKSGKVKALAPFDAAFFKRVARQEKEMFAMYRDQARGDVFDMAYTQLGDDCIAQLYAFLGLAPHTIELPNRKLHSSDTLSRFEPDARVRILRALEAMGHPEWVTE